MRRIGWMIVMVAGLAGCHNYKAADRLGGFDSVTPADGGVRLKVNDANHLWEPKNADKQVTLKPGEHATVGDGFHVRAVVTFVDQKDGRFRFCIKTTSYPPAPAPNETVSYIAVPAYDGEGK